MRETWQPESFEPSHQCDCPSLAPWRQADPIDIAYVPVAPTLNASLQAALVKHISHPTPCSVLVLHIAQFEPLILSSTPSTTYPQRLAYHAPATFLMQIVQNIRRTLRISDHIFVEENGSGAALLFPGVDAEGITWIARRILQGMQLLQAETVVPPLRHETEIVLGTGTSSNALTSLADVLEQASHIQERLTFRPAVVAPPERATAQPRLQETQAKEPREHGASVGELPFMQIPSRLPNRLKQLIPYALALELRCAPIGRNRNRLIVAMTDPKDQYAVARLREATGMQISPASCEGAALEILLASGW